MRMLYGLTIAARPVNCLITFISIGAAGIVAGAEPLSVRVLLAALSGALIAGFGNIINDVYDIEVDKLNKPYRPLIRWGIPRLWGIMGAVILAIPGIGLSLFVHRFAIAIALPAASLLWAYTPFFKGASYLGNFVIATLGAGAFIYGGLAAENPFGAAILALFAFLLHLGREIIKDIQDRPADIAIGHRTGAVYRNAGISRAIAALALSALVIATYMPAIMGFYGPGYLIVVTVGVDLILAGAVYHLIISGEPEVMRRISAWLKFAMPIGLLAVLLGKLGY